MAGLYLRKAKIIFTTSPVSREVVERVLSAINEIVGKHPDKSILIVAHGFSLAVIICHSKGFRMDDVYQHVPNNAQPYRVIWRQQESIIYG